MGISEFSDCKMVMGKINGERIKQGEKIIIDEQGNTDYLTNDQINKIAEESEKRAQKVGLDTKKADEIKDEIKTVETNIQQIEETGIISEENKVSEGTSSESGGESRENKVVSSDSGGSAPSGEESGGSDSGPSESSGGEGAGGGESAPVTGGSIGAVNSNSLIKKIFDWLF